MPVILIVFLVVVIVLVKRARSAAEHRPPLKHPPCPSDGGWAPPGQAPWTPPHSTGGTAAPHDWAPPGHDSGDQPVPGAAAAGPDPAKPVAGGYPGDFEGQIPPWRTHVDDDITSGELVRSLIPTADGHTRTEERDLLIVGHDAPWALGVEVTYELDAAAPGRVDLGTVGSGADARAAQVITDRVVRLDPQAIERLGTRVPGSQLLAVRRLLDER